MTIREEMEQAEHTFLAPWAAFSDQTKGRLRPEEESEVRTCYQRDVDRIVYSKAFRRMKHKTQVFLQPEGDHYRTRLTHTLEVMRISRTIARALRLNEDLTEAIAIRPSATPERRLCRRSPGSPSITMSSPSGWWTSWRRTERD